MAAAQGNNMSKGSKDALAGYQTTQEANLKDEIVNDYKLESV